MPNFRDVPPTHTIKPVDAPPEGPRPTSQQLKADIDSGRTGDKTEIYDPGASPLGTDDEAAGRPASTYRVAIARQIEGIRRWTSGSRRTGFAHDDPTSALYGYVGFVCVVAIIFAGSLWWV
jgi:hypothetical protein